MASLERLKVAVSDFPPFVESTEITYDIVVTPMRPDASRIPYRSGVKLHLIMKFSLLQ